jgi:hypothetical protein
MQELTRDGIKPKGDGTRPLDKILEDMHKDHSVVYYMLPTVEPQKAAPKAKPDKPEKQNWGAPWKGNESSSWRSPKQGQWKQKKGATGQNGGKLPMQLKGCVSHVRKGNMYAAHGDASRSTRTFHAAKNEERGIAPSRTGQPRRNLEFNASLVALSKNNRHTLVATTSKHPLTRTR